MMICKLVLTMLLLGNVATSERVETSDKRTTFYDGCELYLAPSTIRNAGRGIIAGRAFKVNEIIDTAPTISFHAEHSDLTQFVNYVYPSNYANYNMHIFGPSSLYNHMSDKTVQNEWSEHEDELDDSIVQDFSSHRTCTHVVLKDVAYGEEIFTSYGEDWFAQRGMQNTVLPGTALLTKITGDSSENSKSNCSGDSLAHNDTVTAPTAVELPLTSADTTGRPLTFAELKQYGHCVSDVFVAPSTLYRAGRGLFARRNFKQGEVVSVSPVLTLSKRVVDLTTGDSVLMNYCIAAPHSDMVLFPLSYAAMINSNSSRSHANTNIVWHDWAAAKNIAPIGNLTNYGVPQNNVFSVHDKLQMNTTELFAAPFAQLDIAFVAAKDIARGEEITYDHGEEWLADFEAYLQATHEWKKHNAFYEMLHNEQEHLHWLTENPHPVFRHYIPAPPDLFPLHWIANQNK